MTKKRQTKRLSDALFSGTQAKVLGALFGNPARSFYGNELVRAAGGGSGAVQRELARLTDAGLVVVTRIGNQKHFQVNESSPVYGELRGLVIKALGTPVSKAVAPRGGSPPADPARLARALQRLGATQARLATVFRKHGVQRAALFGSVMRDDFRKTSDVDVLVEFLPSDRAGIAGLLALEGELGRLFGGRVVGIASPRIFENPFRRRSIERDLVTVYDADGA